ncbi:branched-chain amino acid ABC transporter permease [Leucobacter allii]|uniref:branched-chain amino acid ABC transporter permease n=1 Tax=Leucobacter allii TaxID=2932247 RepID=UPI001FD5E9F3|nr:branched-chain amino acid ABC transporter permease [Leucobacter allii]UOR01523.1 branched-chain amino acid ABC transporter permease [Leucobacter allii]
MELFLQRIVDGLGNGSIYAALALALVLVFRSTGVVNFAQGEMAMLSTYLIWILTLLGCNVWLALLLAIAASFLFGAAVEKALVRLVPRDDHLVMVVVMIGLYTMLGAIALFVFGTEGKPVQSLFPEGGAGLGAVTIPFSTVGAMVVLLAASGLLWAVFRFTKTGLALRAVSLNPESAALAGLPRARLLAVGWGLAACMGAISGALTISLGLFLEPTMMLPVLVYALSAATLGGFDSPVGAVVAGLVLGVIESLAIGYVTFIGSELALLVPFLVMVLVMLFRPNGLFGSKKVVRV